MNTRLQQGMEVCISVKELYGKFKNQLKFATIVADDGYYDIVDSSGTVLCMDGEQCYIRNIHDGKVEFENHSESIKKSFFLSDEETNVALFL